MICYAFPVAHEAELLLKKCTQRESFSIGRLPCTLANLGARQILVAARRHGPGALAREHAKVVFRYFRPKAVVLAGYGGALVPQLKLGQVIGLEQFHQRGTAALPAPAFRLRLRHLLHHRTTSPARPRNANGTRTA